MAGAMSEAEDHSWQAIVEQCLPKRAPPVDRRLTSQLVAVVSTLPGRASISIPADTMRGLTSSN